METAVFLATLAAMLAVALVAVSLARSKRSACPGQNVFNPRDLQGTKNILTATDVLTASAASTPPLKKLITFV